MSYAAKNLIKNENLVHTGHLHWIYFVNIYGIGALSGLLVLIPVASATHTQSLLVLGFGGVIVGSLDFVFRLVSYLTSEFAITDRRIIIKVGFIRRKTLEIFLGKVESLSVTQSILGRMLGFGTLQISGSGITSINSFGCLADPINFRKIFYEQVDQQSASLKGAS